MRRISRIDRSLDLLRPKTIIPSSSIYLCHACRQRSAPFSTSTTQSARAGEKVPFSEKIRRRIWGTDQPPGLEDPYGNRSAFDQTKKRAKEREVQAATTTQDLGDYEPADTWDGLERVGGFGGWWKENWDPDHQFKGFMPSMTMSDPAEITAALHRATVEVFALRQAGRPVADISIADSGVDLTQDVQIRPSTNGPELEFSSEASLEDIVQALTQVAEESDVPLSTGSTSPDSLDVEGSSPQNDEISVKEHMTDSEENVAADQSEEDPLDGQTIMLYDDLVASWDASWLQISLEDPEIKFAILKRMLQISGIRVSDSVLKSTRTVENLLTHMVIPPKPRQLVEALSQKQDLMSLPNVHVFAARVTPIDKERTIGRWKLIEKELKDRGLPVTGHQ